MKVGDLVKSNHPSWLGRDERVGVIIERISHFRRTYSGKNKLFKVLWSSGTIENSVWDYDLKMIKVLDF